MTTSTPQATKIQMLDQGIRLTVVDRVARTLAREGLVAPAAEGWVSAPGVTFDALNARSAELAAAPTHHACPDCGRSHPIAGG